MKEKAEHLFQQLSDLLDTLQRAADSPDTCQKRQQLQAVEKSIQHMQKLSVPIPDEIRHLKSKLINELSDSDQAQDVLGWIKHKILGIANDFGVNRTGATPAKKRRKRSSDPKTENDVLREHIILSLKHFGGSAKMHDVLDWMEERLKERFTPRDLATHKSGEIIWRNNTQWERFRMIEQGFLKSDSPRGYWELSERQW